MPHVYTYRTDGMFGIAMCFIESNNFKENSILYSSTLKKLLVKECHQSKTYPFLFISSESHQHQRLLATVG